MDAINELPKAFQGKFNVAGQNYLITNPKTGKREILFVVNNKLFRGKPCKHDDVKYHGGFGSVTGKRDADETVVQTLSREKKEELGWNFAPHAHQCPIPDFAQLPAGSFFKGFNAPTRSYIKDLAAHNADPENIPDPKLPGFVAVMLFVNLDGVVDYQELHAWVVNANTTMAPEIQHNCKPGHVVQEIIGVALVPVEALQIPKGAQQAIDRDWKAFEAETDFGQRHFKKKEQLLLSEKVLQDLAENQALAVTPNGFIGKVSDAVLRDLAYHLGA